MLTPEQTLEAVRVADAAGVAPAHAARAIRAGYADGGAVAYARALARLDRAPSRLRLAYSLPIIDRIEGERSRTIDAKRAPQSRLAPRRSRA